MTSSTDFSPGVNRAPILVPTRRENRAKDDGKILVRRTANRMPRTAERKMPGEARP